MRRALGRLGRMNGPEVRFRAAEAARVWSESIRFAAGSARWRPQEFWRRVRPDTPDLASAVTALRAGRFREGEAALRAHFRARERRFPMDPVGRERLAREIRSAFPAAVDDARGRADRILDRRYDLLGYADLSFRTPHAETDWHFDPVHARHAPASTFWRRVPYLDPRCGDHKIVWELNRHQHWLSLGRAAWLAGDSRYAAAIVRELREWMRANPPLAGVNWASMLELGLRSISWLWALQFLLGMDVNPGMHLNPGKNLEDDASDREPGWLTLLLEGLDRQLEHVSRHLSTYFSPNTHLLGEALALYTVGRALPELRGSAAWAETGRAVLVQEAERQVLPDGGHAERSPHYHRYALDFYLFALAGARATADPVADAFASTVSRMATFCRWIADDRGCLPRIGDDDGGSFFPICGREAADARDSLAIASALLDRPDLATGPPPEETFWFPGGNTVAASGGPQSASPPATPDGARLFPDTGYAVLRSAGAHAILDVGPHGYCNGGHAHADALAIVLTVRGVPLLIDPGTATYTMDAAARNRLRSTVMHNTVAIDGRPQSEPDGPFHWKTQADARVECWRPASAFDYVEGSHDGYRPLVHRRAVLATRDGLWLVADHLLGTGTHRADVYWHLDPGWTVTGGVLAARAVGGDDAALFAAVASTAGGMEPFHGDADGLGWCSPVYGRLVPASTLRWSETFHAPATIVTAIAAAGAPVRLTIAAAPLEAGPDGFHRTAVRAAGGGRDVIALFATAIPGGQDGRRSLQRARFEGGVFETDARAALLELSPQGEPLRLSLVDGSRARWTGPSPFAVERPGPAEDLHLDLRPESGSAVPAALRRSG